MNSSSRAYRVGVLFGDGIGPPVVRAAAEVLRAAAPERLKLEFQELLVGVEALREFGTTVPMVTVEALDQLDAALLGPVAHLGYPQGMPNPSAYIRHAKRLVANVRPVCSLEGVPTRYAGVDLVVVRENLEGFYGSRAGGSPGTEVAVGDDAVVALGVLSRRNCNAVAEVAFQLAEARHGRVTVVHKRNVFPSGGRLLMEACAAAAARHRTVGYEEELVDAVALKLVADPSRYDVLVTTNMFGDILSDLCAGLTGGLGVAPGLNVGADFAVAQAVHGAAPDIADPAAANPIAEVLSGALMCDWLGRAHGDPTLGEMGRRVREAVEAALADPSAPRTPDLGGSGGCDDVASAVIERLPPSSGDRPPASLPTKGGVRHLPSSGAVSLQLP